jgi:TonB family protein
MLELKPLIQKPDHIVLRESQPRSPYDPKQRRLMLVALAMLLVALGFVLYRNRDFWFPDEEADSDQVESIPAQPATGNPPVATPVAKSSTPISKSKRRIAASKPEAKATQPAASVPVSATATTSRTVLPPLEVEVVAGDTHRTVRPGSNSVRVDLQPGSPPQSATDSLRDETAANVTNNAAERVQMSADTEEIVSHSVRPGYPLLARQMKVQGSVVLQALIGKDGIIQDLHVVSGPAILASAAQSAVRQWHFKPHYMGSDAVETQAKITVNFTISTN